MPDLFDTTTLNNMVLANRIVRSATWDGLAGVDGEVTADMIDVYERLAEGGVGLVITGHAYVRTDGKASKRQLGVHEDGLVPGLSELAGRVHEAGGRVVLQISHGGCHAATSLTGESAVGPSIMENSRGPMCRALTSGDIAAIPRHFALAAGRARRAGFDGVQVHAAHGYLLSSFLSPFYNRRCDEYGGSPDNRARLLLEVIDAVREETGPDLFVGVKLNSADFVENGLTVDDVLYVSTLLEQQGVDAVELSGGTMFSGALNPVRKGDPASSNQEAWYEETARRFKETVSLPLMLVGGIRTFEKARSLVREGAADYISMARPFIREPGLVARWKSGDTARAACVSDNSCRQAIILGRGPVCVTLERQKTGKV
ncbi:MAG: NADH:flavin oxidoreductase [Desulfatibacillaceae bacterium]